MSETYSGTWAEDMTRERSELRQEVKRLKRELKAAVEIAAAVARPMKHKEFEDTAMWIQEFHQFPPSLQLLWRRRIRRAIKEM